jgi:hypothetical protein
VISASDIWTPAHAIIGLFFGRIKYPRLLYYPIPFGWEIYQVYFHYQPMGYTFDQYWLNTLLDILAGLIGYEVVRLYWTQKFVHPLWLRFSTNAKALAAYIFVAAGITWLLWNEILLGEMAPKMPSTAFPLILGALSPIAAAFVIHYSIYKEGFTIKGWSRMFPRNWNYYLINGLFPSVITGLIIMAVEFVRL